MAARVGFVICVLLLGMLILSAARVRAIGGHEHIFTFSEVSFLATFNDGLAIIIIVIGLLSSVIAIWKGYAGLSDPVPNLTAAFKYAVEGCNEKVSDLVESTIEALETRCDECLDTCEDALDLAQDAAQSVRDDVATLNDDIRDFNAQIDHEKAVLALYANESMAGYEQVYRSGDATPVNLGLEAFDELRLKLIDPDTVNDGAEQTESISKIKSLMSDVTTLKHDIITQIEASEAEYIAATPLISVLSKPQGV